MLAEDVFSLNSKKKELEKITMYDKRISQRKNYLKPIPQKGKITKTPFKRNFCRRKAYKCTQQDVESEHTQQNEQQVVEYQSDWSTK
ncbi:22830_t:CDS:2 [Gigaspora margarita]|uniref:22830_t:CDS:1 n=1 Tax=Gigaspora margarita TaxID=4874 RepID=A0ABN7VRU8_GIGMA|nr:22830_t:CDS:2 [Gigaspora margarita]